MTRPMIAGNEQTISHYQPQGLTPVPARPSKLRSVEDPSGLEDAGHIRQPIQAGNPVLIFDDCAPHGSSAIMAAARVVTDRTVNFLSRLSGGLLQVAISPSRSADFMLHPLRSRHDHAPAAPFRAPQKEEWLVSVEARHGVGSGISISDRRTTIRLLGSEDPQPSTLARPGHIFPCRCHPGGVIARAAIPEAALDLVVGCGMTDAAVFSYLLDEKGEVSSPTEAQVFAKKNNIPAIALSTILSWRLRHECLIEKIASSELPTVLGGNLRMHVFRSLVDSSEQVALVKGSIDPDQSTLVRVHVEEPIDDLIGTTSSSGSTSYSSRNRLDTALKCLDEVPCGVLVYLRPSLQRYALSTRILHTDPSEQATQPLPASPTTGSSMTDFGIGAQILRAVGVKAVTILCRTKRPYEILELFGLHVVGYRELT